MNRIEQILSQMSADERHILSNLIAFRDFFSVDWFVDTPDMLPSKLFPVILSLHQEQWISPMKGHQGSYEWSKKFPRDEIIANYIPDISRYRRMSIKTLLKSSVYKDSYMEIIANQCIEAGLEESDLDILYQATLHAELNHKIALAISLHDHLIEFIENNFLNCQKEPRDEILHSFIKSVERRAAFSFFRPDLKKIGRLLLIAHKIATRLNDQRAIASLTLLKGQNCWMSFKYEQAIQYFNEGWQIAKELNDEKLMNRGMKAQGMACWINGQLCKAIGFYEESLGELEPVVNDDFSLLTALNLALAYTQIGMPQRGLGITDTILKHGEHHNNSPLIASALVITGMILLEMRELRESRSYLERTIEISKAENLPLVEVMASMGLAAIEYWEGNYDLAAERYKILWKVRKSSWYHILNQYHLFEIGYLLHAKGISPIDLRPVFNYLNDQTKEQVNPLVFGLIRRLHVMYLETETSPKEKLEQLLELENIVEQVGSTLELSKLRIDIAKLYLQNNELTKVQHYGNKAWKFLKTIARNIFPPDLQYMVTDEHETKEDQLYTLMLEMGDALISQDKIEQLLTNIMTSISRLTGAERTAIFIRNKNSTSLDLVASRNLLKEHINESRFKDTLSLIHSTADKNEDNIIQYEVAEKEDFRRVIITPLKLGKKVIGILYQDSRFFSIDQSRINLLSALASQIAISIDRARAYDEIARLNKRLIQENRYYVMEEFRPFGEIIGNSDANLIVQQLIYKVAPTPSTVLIQGETGVGKELVARAIHRQSERRERPFIRVNCAALPETLIDSELFGHEKGAFTGAIKTKAGRFELAHEGTIFLDEVSELPLSTQSRLLRVLQEKEFQRVGGTTMLSSDFRLISASNKNLEQAVEDGGFRPDLFYRLNVFPIYVAPLRERIEDIPLLAHHFLKNFSAQYNKNYSGIPELEVEKLMSYSWPGNVRELSNMIERAVILGGPKLNFPELNNKKRSDSISVDFVDVKHFEKNQILKALAQTNGKIGGKGGAAALLGLKRTTFMYRMKILGISIEKTLSP